MTLLRQLDFNAANMSAFGTLESDGLTPVFQADFVNGLNSQLWQTPVASGTGAAVDTDAARLRLQSGTANNGYAYILTRRPLVYRAGQGMVGRFTPIFATPQANSLQLWGVGALSGGTPYDGYFYGFNGLSFGIAHYNRGSAVWYPQASAWVDKVDGSAGSSFNWNKGYGVPVQVKWPYLGYGDIGFWAQNPAYGSWVLNYLIQYANTSAQTQLSNPRLYWMGFVQNSGNTTNLTMYCGSVGVFISGQRSYVGNPNWTAFNNKSGITTETNILALRNATTYNGTANRGLIRLKSVTISSSGTAGICTFQIKINPTLGGTPAYAPKSGSTADNGVTVTAGNSIASVDTAGTTLTGGTDVWSATMDNPNTQVIDIENENIFVAPGEIASVSGLSSNSSQLGVSLNWSEDI